MIFDKWEVISDLNKIDKNFKLNLKKFSDKDMIVQSIDELNNLCHTNDFNSYYLSEILNYRFASTDKFVINYSDKREFKFKLVQKKFRNAKSKKMLFVNLIDFCSQKTYKSKIRNFKTLFRYL